MDRYLEGYTHQDNAISGGNTIELCYIKNGVIIEWSKEPVGKRLDGFMLGAVDRRGDEILKEWIRNDEDSHTAA